MQVGPWVGMAQNRPSDPDPEPTTSPCHVRLCAHTEGWPLSCREGELLTKAC